MAVAASEAERSFRQSMLPDANDLSGVLTQALALANQAHAGATVLALTELGDIDLPDTTPSSAEDQAQIRAIAPLYLAAQLEEAGLLSAVETISGLAVSGALQVNLGRAATLIQDFWQQRHERFHENERRALYARLFGADQSEHSGNSLDPHAGFNEAFENLMIDLAESLYKLDEATTRPDRVNLHAQNRLVIGARNLAENLLNKGGGMTAFAAQEILSTIQAAVQILQQPAVQHAFDSRSMWGAVRAIGLRYLHLDRESSSYVARGKSGLIVLSWLADSLPHLGDRQPLATIDHPVIGAATEWLQASLAIREAGAQTGG